jgi:hypothetical protein
MVEARLARLPLEAQRVLRAASVFGEVSWEGGVAALLADALPAPAVAEHAARLVEQELLVVRPRSRFVGERELAFRHALLREGAYAMLPDESRRRSHRAAGEWLAQRGEVSAMVLAGHFERGGEPARAAGFYLRAAEQATAVMDYEAAMARTARGLGCAPPEELRLALLGVRCEAAWFSVDLLAAVAAEAQELMRVAPRGGGPWAQGMLARVLGALMTGQSGEIPGLIAELSGVQVTAATLRPMGLAYNAMTIALDAAGRRGDATAMVEQFARLVGAELAGELQARFWRVMLGEARFAFVQEDPWAGLASCAALDALQPALGSERIALVAEMVRGM